MSRIFQQFLLAFLLMYIVVFLANIGIIYFFDYLKNGSFPININEFYKPVIPSLIVSIAHVVVLILFPKDKKEVKNKSKK